MNIGEFQAAKKSVSVPQGDIAYVDIGEGPVALFIHGVFLNGLLWSNVIEQVATQRRCIALDLPAHGDTQVGRDADFTLDAHAALIAEFLDALGIDRVDLVGNDTGGAISQMFAVRYPDRVRTLTLTNCDVNENFPPDAFKDQIELARQGQLGALVALAVDDLELARSENGLGVGYQYPERITAEKVRAFLGRYTSPEAQTEIDRRIAEVAEGGLTDIEDAIKELIIPTLAVWGTDDKFFDVKWAYWLRDNVPGVTEVVEIDGGKLFFPDERASELAGPMARHWEVHSDVVTSATGA